MDIGIQEICDNIIEQYRQDKNVLGIMLFGSAVRSKFDQYSDVDIYILLNKKGKCSRINFYKNGLRVDVILDAFEEAKNYLDADKGNVRRNTSHMLAYGEIIFHRNSEMKKIQQLAKSNLRLKTKYTNGEILMHKYSIDDFWGEIQRDIKNKDYVAFGLDSQLLVNNILELFLKLNGAFLRQPSEMASILQRLDVRFAKYVENFYKESDIQKKKNILAGLIEYIYKESGGPLPESWVIKD